MPGERRTIGSFPNVFNIRQGSTSRSPDLAQQASLSDMLNPVDSRFSDYMISPHDTCENSENPAVQSFNGLDSGESSSRVDFNNQVCDDRMKVEDHWPASSGSHPGTSVRLEERQFESSDLSFSGRSNTHSFGREPLQASSSSHMTHNVNFSMGYSGANFVQGVDENFDGCKSNGMEMEQPSATGASFDHVGSSSGNSGFIVDEDNGDSSSLENLGSSCKRKALEGSSSRLYPGGSSSAIDAEDGVWPNNLPSSSSTSTPSHNFPNFEPPVFQNSRAGIAIRGMTSDSIPSSSIGRNSANSLRNFGRRIDTGQQLEIFPLNLSSTGTTRNSNFSPPHHMSRSIPLADSLELRLTAGGATANSDSDQSQSNSMHASRLSLNFHDFAWNGSSNPAVDSMSNPLVPRERVVLEDSNLRIGPRHNAEHSVYAPAAEIRNSENDPATWNVAAGSSGSVPSSIWAGSHPNFNHFPAPSFIPPHNAPSHNAHRLSDLAHWSLFPTIGSDPGMHNGHFNSFSAGPPSSSQESIIPSRSNGQGHRQHHPRSSFSMERRSSGIPSAPHSLRGLVADIEGRRRLISEIRQVLNAMRRGENLRAEDYMLFDPLVYQGMAEMHDRHRDMRLDVDNMSYEELLALEERIGDVSTGLSEDKIMKLMKQRKYESTMTELSPEIEPCCICQEEYAEGEDIGSLDCGHDFHTDCIKQWLMQKNLCPICKTGALNSG